mgnify:CR=1 FL=1
MAKYVFGIDLGTTYSCIARVDETARAELIKNFEGEYITPSVVLFDGDNVIVGSQAKAESVLNPKTTSMLVKTLMGKTDFAIEYNGEVKSPSEVSSYILQKLAKDASEQLGVEVKDVVITCPAYFGTAERMATKNAGELAGLNVLEIISEPTAAALYYGCTKQQDEKTILVYDLGGGTFDVTIMRISSSKIEIVCSDGDHDLGGKNWDQELEEYLSDQYKREFANIEFSEYEKQELILKVEKIKKNLSSRNQASDILSAGGNRRKISITREKFDEITELLLERTLIKTENAIEIAKEKGYDKIDEILLVGGSTRMPQINKALVNRFKDTKIQILEPDEAVAKGAAIYAVNVYEKNQKILTEQNFNSDEEVKVVVDGNEKTLNAKDYEENLAFSPEMMNIGGSVKEIIMATTKSFAIKIIKNGKEMCFNMIIKNESMPNGIREVSEVFGTLYPNQKSVSIEIYENDCMDKYFEIEEELKLGDTILELPGNLPQNSPIEVTLKLSNEGILQVTGLDKTGNRKIEAKMKAKGIMSEEEFEKVKQRMQGITVI